MKNTKKLYDFYTKESKVHFNRQEMTLKEAEKLAEKFELTFEEVKE